MTHQITSNPSEQLSPKKKLLVSLSGNIFVRNFVDSGALDRLLETYDVGFLVAPEVSKSLPPRRTYYIYDAKVKARTVARYKTGYLSMKRYWQRSKSFPLKLHATYLEKLPSWKRLLFYILSAPGIFEIFEFLYEARLGTLPEIDRAIQDFLPDLVLIPSGFSDSFSIDCLKSAKKAGIPSAILMFNWDNVSCKGVLPLRPDFMGVWGQQTREQAVRIHKMKESAVAILGSPQFEDYFRWLKDPQSTGGGTKKKILFLGIARFRDEIEMLDEMENGIESGKIPAAEVIYRPHPWKEVKPGEVNFFDRHYKHISMDPQLESHYQKLFQDPNFDPAKFAPEYKEQVKILARVDAVISPLTTMGLEAMLLGKPVLLPVYPDPKFPFSVDTLIHYDHHTCWREFRDILVCDSGDRFVSMCAELLQKAGSPEVSERLQRDVKSVIYYDDRPYTDRLSAWIGKIISERAHA